jgi:uncharacterized membrane protein YgcG
VSQARLQNPGSEFKNTWQVVRQTIKQEGIQGLYRGLGTVISIGTPAFVLYLATYEQTKKALLSFPALQENYQFVGHFLSGITAETVSCLVYVPVDVIKERLQVQRKLRTGQEISGSLPMYRGTWHALATIMETEGLRGVYRGYGATLLSFGPFSAFYFLFYEKFKAWSAKTVGVEKVEEIPFQWTLASAAGAGALASWITNPVDLVRLRLQVQRGAEGKTVGSGAESAAGGGGGGGSGSSGSSKPAAAAAIEPYRNTLDGLRKIYRREGLYGWFKGSGARIAFHSPSTMISMSLYDILKNEFHRFMS